MLTAVIRRQPYAMRCSVAISLSLGKVFVLVHIKIWIGILMYEKSSMMLTGFIRLRQRPQCKFRSPTFICLPIVSVRLIMPTRKFNASIRLCHPSCWAVNLSMIPFRPRLFADLKGRLAHFAAIHPSSPPMMNWKVFYQSIYPSQMWVDGGVWRFNLTG